MVVEDDALQLGHIGGVIRVLAGHLKLGHAPAGDLHPGEAELHAVHVLGHIIRAEAVINGGGKLEHTGDRQGGGILIILVTHNLFLLKLFEYLPQ